jgi:hypothetical protein
MGHALAPRNDLARSAQAPSGAAHGGTACGPPRARVDGVTERTGGVPLFVEEVTRLLLERGKQGGIQAIPPTLQQLLTARLDRLGPVREVAQGSVIGRSFSYACCAQSPAWRTLRCKPRWNGSRKPTFCWSRACRRNPIIALIFHGRREAGSLSDALAIPMPPMGRLKRHGTINAHIAPHGDPVGNVGPQPSPGARLHLLRRGLIRSPFRVKGPVRTGVELAAALISQRLPRSASRCRPRCPQMRSYPFFLASAQPERH